MQEQAETFELGGRPFRQIQTRTFELMMELDRLVIESGISKLLQSGPNANENGGAFGARLWETISRSNKSFAFVAALIIPANMQDVDWTPDEAARTASFVKKLHDLADFATMQQLLIRLVISFFATARRSRELFDIASQNPAPVPETARHC